jgi:type IV secretory pathway VirB10-like protein
MIRSRVILAILLGTAVAGCQRAPEPAAAQPSPSALAGQGTLAPGQAPAPGQGREATPIPGAPAAPGLAPEPPAQEATSAAPRQAPRASSRTRTAQAPRSTTAGKNGGGSRADRVDRMPAAEPIDIPTDESRRGEPEPTMAREPNRDRLVLPAGTELQLVLENGLSSATSQVGDPVTARVSRATAPDGRVVLPGGTVLKGRVYRADAAGRVKGRARLAVDFDRIVVRGEEHRLDTTAIDVQGPDSHGRDAAIIGGSTVGGAIVGGILGGGKGAKKGAVIGAVGGTGAVLATKGHDVEIPSGSRWTVRVKDRVALN